MKKAPCIGMMLAPCGLEAPDTVPGDSVVRSKKCEQRCRLFKANMKKVCAACGNVRKTISQNFSATSSGLR